MEIQLPTGYTHKITESDYSDSISYTVQIRVNITCEDEAKAWMQEFSEITMTTWRVKRTYPCSGCKVIYKREFRCRYNKRKKPEDSQGKLTGDVCCPAKILLQIKRYRKRSRAKNEDPFMPQLPCILNITFMHNHNIGIQVPEFRHEDVCTDVRDQIIHLFKLGHTPVSAYHAMQSKFNKKYHSSTYLRPFDRKINPGKQYYYGLYSAEFGNNEKSGNKNIIINVKTENNHDFVQENCEQRNDFVEECIGESDYGDNSVDEDSQRLDSPLEQDGMVLEIPMKQILELAMCVPSTQNDICRSRRSNVILDTVCVPPNDWTESLNKFEDCISEFVQKVTDLQNKEAVDVFVKNYQECARTSQSLIAAMRHFGKSSESCIGLNVVSQPFTVEQREVFYEKNDHAYVRFNNNKRQKL